MKESLSIEKIDKASVDLGRMILALPGEESIQSIHKNLFVRGISLYIEISQNYMEEDWLSTFKDLMKAQLDTINKIMNEHDFKEK